MPSVWHKRRSHMAASFRMDPPDYVEYPMNSYVRGCLTIGNYPWLKGVWLPLPMRSAALACRALLT